MATLCRIAQDIERARTVLKTAQYASSVQKELDRLAVRMTDDSLWLIELDELRDWYGILVARRDWLLVDEDL